MTFESPTITELISRIKTDLASVQVTTVDGTQAYINVSDKNSKTYADIVALASLTQDLYKIIQLDVIPNSFASTVKIADELQKFADQWDVQQNVATGSNGSITLTGTIGSTIPLGTELTVNSISYLTLSTTSIASNAVSISSITRSGSTATATTSANHNFSSGQTVPITGANETDYNGSFVITSTGLDEFSYIVAGTPSTPATGTIVATASMASVEVDSVETGQDVNLDSGDTLTLVNSIAGVDNTAFVQFGGVAGGTDDETFESWKTRVTERIKNPITRYNEANIRTTAKSVAGVTKVWVESVTPAVGQTTVYFIRGNDASIIPSASEVAQVKTVLDDELLGVDRSTSDLIVNAPTPVSTNFTFSAISPDTTTMRTAITNSLTQFFAESTEVSESITALQYNNAIGSSFDLETGESLASYTLSAPSGAITIATGELGTLGSIVYP